MRSGGPTEVTPPPRGEFRLLFLGADGLRTVTDWIAG